MAKLREYKPNTFIYEKSFALTRKQCQLIIDTFEAHPEDHHPGAIANYVVDPTIKKSMDVAILEQPHWKDVDDILFKSVGEAIDELTEMFPDYFATHLISDRGYQIKRTEPQGFYTWHYDSDNPDKDRMMVAIWYLNTDYEGGTTDFKAQDIQVKPQTGKLLLFPTFWTHYHRGDEVISGTKYIATTWLAATR